MVTRATTALGGLSFCLALLLSACNVDFGGLFYSESTPDQRFTYSRQTSDPVWSGAALGTDYRFVMITDTHVENQANNRFADLKPQLSGDAFLVCAGDLTQNGQAADFAAWLSLTADLGLPAYATIGNHDLYSNGWSHMQTAISQTSYTFCPSANLRLIFLDTGNATLGQQQFRWLKSVLSSASEANIVVITHYPFFSTGFSDINTTDPEESAALAELFANHGVKLVLDGHTHSFYQQQVGPTTYLTGDDLVPDRTNQSFIRVRVSAAGLSWEQVPLP